MMSFIRGLAPRPCNKSQEVPFIFAYSSSRLLVPLEVSLYVNNAESWGLTDT